MCIYRDIGLLLLGLFLVASLKAQKSFDYPFRYISQPDGLMHNEVLSIAQDARGFIWIAARSGLQRYDGAAFIYYPEMLSSAVEGRNTGAAMYADKINNRLWITNNTSLEKMELKNTHFTFYDPEKILTDTSFVFDTCRDKKNVAWLLNTTAVFLHDTATKKNKLYRLNILPANAHQTSFIVTDSSRANTWVAPGAGLMLFDIKKKQLHTPDFNPGNHPLLNLALLKTAGLSIRLILMDSWQNIWLTTWGDTLYKFDNKTKKVNTYSLTAIKIKEQGAKAGATPLVNCMLEDDNHSIWIGTENAGLLRYNPEKDDFDYCVARGKNSEGIRYDYKIFSLFQDREQNIWVGTDKGISIFNPYRQYFKSVRHQENNPLSISKSEIISFTQIPGGDIFIGTWGGGMAVYDNNFNFKKNIFFTGNPDKNKIWCFLQIDKEILCIGCQHGHFLLYNIHTGIVKDFQPPQMQTSTIRCLQKDNKGNVLFGLHNGKIVKWDRKVNAFLTSSVLQKDHSEKISPVADMYIDKEQHCWVSTDAGFKQFDVDKMAYVNSWLPVTESLTGLSGKTCEGIEAYNDSILLIGTVYGGINFFNKRTHLFSHLGIADGLPSNTVYAIKKDSAGYIWFTTDYGLYKFNPADKKVIPYTMEPGLMSSSFTSPKFYPLQSGRWMTCTLAEVISFFPDKPTQSRKELSLKTAITGFKLFNKPLFIDSLLDAHQPVRLTYKENFFTVEFAALNFLSLHQTNYYYRLNGVDKDWVNGGNNRFANYTGLPPGEYTFDVKAENGNGGDDVTSLAIIISPAVWQTWWFRGLGILLAVLIAYKSVKRRIKEIKHEAQMKQKIAETEMMALRAQMNPHFIFNCLNSIDNLIQIEEKERATTYLSKFAKLIRSILENSNKNVVPCWKDIEMLRLYLELEELRWDKKITYQLVVSDEILNGDYKVPPLIIQPFVENAIHHGLLNKIDSNKRLLIQVSVVDNRIHYIIEDNGVGRAKANTYKQLNKQSNIPMGMKITTDRINLFNRNKNGLVNITDMKNDAHEPCGTKVIIELINQS